jgi:hypothetical protein
MSCLETNTFNIYNFQDIFLHRFEIVEGNIERAEKLIKIFLKEFRYDSKIRVKRISRNCYPIHF